MKYNDFSVISQISNTKYKDTTCNLYLKCDWHFLINELKIDSILQSDALLIANSYQSLKVLSLFFF